MPAPDKKAQKHDQAKLFLKDVLAKIPEDKRKSAEELLSGEEVLDVLGDGVLRQSDYSRSMDKTREETERAKKMYEENVVWRAEQKAAFDQLQTKSAELAKENERFRKALRDPDQLLNDDDDDPAHPRPPAKDYISKEEAEELWAKRKGEIERDGVALMSRLTAISTRHLKDFNEVLDTDALIKHATEKGMNIDAAYRDFTSERVSALAEEKHKKEIEEARVKARQETLDEVRRSTPVLPHVIGNNEPSISQQLKADKKDFGAKAAVDEYWKMQPSGGS